MRVYWAAAWLLFFLSPASAAIDAVNVYEPRNFGYFIGDTLERDIEVVTSGKTELFTAALPRPGSLTYWLDLVSISHTERDEGGRRHYDLKLKYQIFYSAIEATELDIPAFPLKFKNPASVALDGTSPNDASDAAAKRSASIPAFRIIVAPLRDLVLVDLMPEKTKELSEVLRPGVPAREIPVAGKKQHLALAAVVLSTATLLLLWHYSVWPFRKRAGRPFTRADRQIRDLLAHGAGDPSYREALLVLHRAFDEAAGQRIFSNDAIAFAEAHPVYRGFSPRLKAFFESSRLYFFSDDRSAAERLFPVEKLRTLASDLAREERARA